MTPPAAAPTAAPRYLSSPRVSRVVRSCSHPPVVCRSSLSCAISQFSCVRNCRAVPAVLAVPAMPVEKDQVQPHRSTLPLVHPVEALDARSSAACSLGVELPHSKVCWDMHRLRRLRTHRLRTLRLCTLRLRTLRLRTLRLRALRRSSLSGDPGLLRIDHGHSLLSGQPTVIRGLFGHHKCTKAAAFSQLQPGCGISYLCRHD